MVRPIYVPQAGRFVNFSDTASNEDIKSYIREKFPKAQAPAPVAPPAAPAGPDQSTISQRALYGVLSGFTEIPGGIASLLYPAEEAAKTAAGQWSAGNRAYLQEALNIDPTKEATTSQALAQGLGSLAGFVIPGGAVAKGAGLLGAGARLATAAGTATVAGQGAALNAGSRSQKIMQQLESGMEISPETQLAAQRLDGLIGLSEAFPMNKFFGPIGTILSKVPASKAPIVEKIIANRLSKITRAGAAEGIQEAASGIASDLMEYGVYNPNVEIGQDIVSNAGVGAFSGSVLEGVIQLAAGRKLRGARQLQTDIASESNENSAQLRQATITNAAESLRNSGVEGTLSVEANEGPEGEQRFTIMSSTGSPILDMPSEDDAVQAIELYKSLTGANVTTDVKAVPKLNPIQIGNRRFPTMEAALAEKENLTKRVASLEGYKSNVELVKKEAEAQGIAPIVHAKRIDDALAKTRSSLDMFEKYFNPQTEEAAAPEGEAPAAATPEPAAAEPVAPEPVAPVETPELTEEDYAPVPEAAIPEEPIVSEEDIPEMPIGAVEMPIEESRILPDSIVDDQSVPEVISDPIPVRTEERPSATVEDLAALQTEMFGKPTNIREMDEDQRSAYVAERDRRFPPQETDVYYSGGPLSEPAPRNMREAAIAGPTVKDYTPETQQWMKAVYDNLRTRVRSILPGEVDINLKAIIEAPEGLPYLIRGQARAEKGPDGLKSIIDLATGILRPGVSVEEAVKTLAKTMNHEMVHVLRTKGVFRPSEWKILSRAVSATNMPGKKYTYLDKAQAIYAPMNAEGISVPISPEYADPDAVVEEAVADMYRDWVIEGNKPLQNSVGLLNRITEFFRRIFQTLRNARHDDIFKRIETGEIGNRTGEVSVRGTLLSAGPTANMAVYTDDEGVHVRDFPEGNTGSSTAYLRTDFERYKAKGKRTEPQLGAALDAAFLKKFGRTYDINDPVDYQSIVASIADEISLQMRQVQSGVGWYDSDITDVFNELSKSFPILKDPSDGPAYRQMFTMIAGVMSNGMKAKANVELAAINFANFLNTGVFSSTHPFTKTGWNQRSNIMGPQIAMLNSMVSDVRFAPRQGSNNPRLEQLENFLKFMFSEHSVREINQFRAKHGTKSPAKIGKLDDRRLGMYAFGPKFGPFILNLNGLSDETVDSWATRSFYRHMGRGVGADGELVKAPLTNVHREAMKRALRDVGLATNLSSRDIQAVLWFYEKELYNQLGQIIPLEVFSDGAREFTKKYGTGPIGPLRPRTGREGEISRAIKTAGARTSPVVPRGTRFSAAPIVNSPEFNRWFKESKASNPDGSPLRYYHGTPFTFREFGKGRSGAVGGEEGPFYFSTSAKYANQYAETKIYAGGDGSDVKRGGKVIPVYISAQRPFDYENPEHVAELMNSMGDAFPGTLDQIKKGAWKVIENKAVQRAIRDLGFDGFYLNEAGFKNLAVYKPEQVKSIFNQFEEGAAVSKRFSAAPLPTYVQQQNDSLFAPVPKISFRDMMFNYAFGNKSMGKTLRTLHGDVDIAASTMAGIAGKAAAVDKNAYITHLESLLNQRNTGNFQRMEADYSATAALAWRRRASHLMASMMLRGKLVINFARTGDIQSATMKVEEDEDSLKNIFKTLLEPGPVNPATGKEGNKLDVFRSYAVARRGEWLRSTGQNVPREITPQYVRETVAFTQREYPEVIEAYNKYQRFNKNLLTAAKDAGIISQAELGRLTNQMNYYGFIYEVYGEPMGPNSSQKTASKFKLRPYTGTQAGGLTNDPMFVMLQNAQFWVDSIAKNLAATKSFELARQMGEARTLRESESPDEMRGEVSDPMYYSENGVVRKFAVKDPLLVSALGSDDRISVGRFWEALGLPAHILRESVTRDPGFMARNLLRDTLSSWITSGADFMPVIDTIKGMRTALKDGASFKALAARGAVGTYDLAMLGPSQMAQTLRRNAMPINVHTIASVEGGTAALGSLWNRLGNISEASDAATRIAVYDACKKQGMSDAEATMQAIELLDFTRRGGSQTLGILTKIIPFLNARIQGMDVLYQAGRSGIRFATGSTRGEKDANIGKKFLVRGAMLAAISIGLEALNQDDEDYKQLDDYIKNGNMLIPLKEFGLKGEFLAIPKPFEAGLLFSTIPQQIYKTTTGEASTRENVELFWDQLASTFGVNPIPQAILPPMEIITNHNFYTGLPLISEGKSRLAPELQYNTNTSQIAMMIGGLPIFYNMDTGRFGGMSPIQIDKLISGYGGPIGTYMVQAVSLAMKDFGDIGPERMPSEMSNLPVVKSFFIDAKNKNPKVVTQAYELFRITDEVNRTMSRLRQSGDAEALAEYVEENRDIIRNKKYVFSLADRLNKISAQERMIERSEDMSRDEKLAAQQRLRDVRLRLASRVGEINEKLGR
jgi:hypothetical protein